MKKVLAFFVYILIAIFFVVVFLPKINLYYKAEELLHSKSVVITQESMNDSGLSFSISDAKLYYGDLYVAEFSSISLTTLILYNSLSVDSFTLSKDMKQFLPREMEGITIMYTPFNPLHVSLDASGEFGELEGDVDIATRHITLHLLASPMLTKQSPFWLRKLKKVEGEYIYELNY